jgi:F-type H+-transporting ATPase subunit a
MRRMVVAAAVLMAGVAFASTQDVGETTPSEAAAAHGPGAEHEEESVADYILHHVSDSTEYEFEVPLSYDHPTVHLPQILIPLKAGACDMPAAEGAEHGGGHGAAHPGLGAGCLDLSITKHTVFMWLAAVLLLVVMLTATHRDRKQLVPRGTWANLFEALVLFVRDELAIKNIGKEYGPRLYPYML